MPLIDVAAALAESAVTWADLAWIREHWRGPIVVKGVLTATTRAAPSIKAQPPSPSPITAAASSIALNLPCAHCPKLSKAVHGQTEILLDGGIRRGTDIAKALALGARAVLCGRAYAYGLAAAGEAGVNRAIEILRTDLDRTLRLLGCASVTDLDRSYVNIPKSWSAD